MSLPMQDPRISHPTALAKNPLRRRISVAALFVLLGLAAAGLLRAGQAASDAKKSGAGSHGVDMSILDKTCKPC